MSSFNDSSLQKFNKMNARIEGLHKLWLQISSQSLLKRNVMKFLYQQLSHKLHFDIRKTTCQMDFQQTDLYMNICMTQPTHIRIQNLNLLHLSAWCKPHNTQGKIIYDFITLYEHYRFNLEIMCISNT